MSLLPLAPELDKPEVLAYLAALLAYREGDEKPQIPVQLTISHEELAAHLQDPKTREAIVQRLSVLVRPNRKARRRRQ
jgi:hypothetical protein